MLATSLRPPLEPTLAPVILAAEIKAVLRAAHTAWGVLLRRSAFSDLMARSRRGQKPPGGGGFRHVSPALLEVDEAFEPSWSPTWTDLEY